MAITSESVYENASASTSKQASTNTATDAITLIKSFHRPVHDSQVVFRQLLKAMSEPGVLVSVNSPEGLAPLYASTFSVCQALLDQQTPLWLSPTFDIQTIKHNLHFHTGVPVTTVKNQAVFALGLPEDIGSFVDLPKGNSEYPETNCSVILQVDAILSEQDSAVDVAINATANTLDKDMQTLRLTGPGIATERLVHIRHLSPLVLTYLTNKKRTFPLGLDFILVAQEHLICLPRTTQVEVISCT